MVSLVEDQKTFAKTYLDEIYDDLSEKTSWSREFVEKSGEEFMLHDKIMSSLPNTIEEINFMKEKDDMTTLDPKLAFENAGYHDFGDFQNTIHNLPPEQRYQELSVLFDGYLNLIQDKVEMTIY